jgi:TolB protein
MKRRIIAGLLALAFAAVGLLADASPRAGAIDQALPANGRLAFTQIEGNGASWSTFSILPDGQSLRQLTTLHRPEYAAAYSPDGSKLAFYSTRATPNPLQIYIMDAEGGHQTRLTDNTTAVGSLTWSPDNERIAFASNHGPQADISVADVEHDNVVNLTNSPDDLDASPSWSPDGTRIAFSSSRAGNDEIFVMEADGSNPINLTNDPASDVKPSWSPDGSQIAFIHHGNILSEIYLMNSDGTDVHLLSPGLPEPDQIAWAPDGERLLYVARITGSPSLDQVFTIQRDGTDNRNVSHNTEIGPSPVSPVWSPDGSQVAFVKHHIINGFAYHELHIVNADGTNAHEILRVSVNNLSSTTWQPFFHRAGDVNCAGVTNAIDAAIVLQYGAGLIGTLPCEDDADVNGDGDIDSVDAALILQYTAGLLDSLPS